MSYKVQLVGFKRSDFSAPDGTSISGYKLYALRDFGPSDGVGYSTVETYATMAKLGGVPPHIGSEIYVDWSTFKGKGKWRFSGVVPPASETGEADVDADSDPF